ncbi:hydrolase [Streptomyces sp. TRM76323]|uniref:Hydrolase n=1 Tax=Streptomyces tamarix TaxID=3078565 RepID=A0ABU3QD17_9ACTN|nr:hydrolase [Streptomyces tamarix]MDT9680665.1 hydrolase [Streptomyces tamarix]
MPHAHQSSLASAARDVAPLAAAHAATAEERRRLHPAVAEALIAAGFPHHFAPDLPGRSPGTFTGLLEAVAVLGEECASAAWVASVTASAGRMTAHLPAEGRAAVWEKGAGTVVVAGLMPAGTAQRVPGGWRVRGEWAYVSGVDFADWTLVAARTEEAGRTAVRVLAVPRADHAVVDSWFVIGMRGTGSHTVVLDDVVVPDERSVPLEVVLRGEASEGSAPCHRVPLKAGNGLTLAAPLLGAARGALRRWRELTGAKLAAPGGAISGGPDPGPYEQVLARAEGELDAVELLLGRAARVVDRGGVTAVETARNARDCALAAERLAAVVDGLLRTAGTRGQAEAEALQRHWRDVNCGAGHSGLQWAPAASAYARLVGAPGR